MNELLTITQTFHEDSSLGGRRSRRRNTPKSSRMYFSSTSEYGDGVRPRTGAAGVFIRVFVQYVATASAAFPGRDVRAN